MRDLVFMGFIAALFLIALKRPFLFVLSYVYVDILAPQRLSYMILDRIPISLICFCAAAGSWLILDDKRGVRFTPRQWLMTGLLLYCGLTTMGADFPVEAQLKWSWVWKSLIFAIFLPLTLRTRLRMESLTLFMLLSASSIIIVGGIKTLVTGGGYGTLNLMVTNNSGIYESSTIAMVSIAIIPFILFFMKRGTIFPPDWRVRWFGYALIFACLLIPIGTQARTGLICAAVLYLLILRTAKRRILYLFLSVLLGAAAVPLLPDSFTGRMQTIENYQADSSASTRIAVWKWTWEFAKKHPFGGGFESYRQNSVRYEAVQETDVGSGHTEANARVVQDEARAFHSSYFEMLGEQGYLGLIVWLMIHGIGIYRMELLSRRFGKTENERDIWIAGLGNALQKAHIIYLVGSLFVGMAFQSFVYMLVGLQIALDVYASKVGAPVVDAVPMQKAKHRFGKTPQPV